MAFSFSRRSACGGPGASREASLASFEARTSRADESQTGLARGGPGASREASLASLEARSSRADESQAGLVEGAGRRALLLHTLRRAAVIFGLGLALNTLSFFLFHRSQVRIPGVLQRIGVCFFFAALIYVLFGRKGLLPAAAVLLAVYWALMTFVPAPGYGTGRLDVEGNLAAYVDRAVLGTHNYQETKTWALTPLGNESRLTVTSAICSWR